MNKRIKELAEQAGYMPDGFGIGHWDMPECKRFYELVRQDEREACAQLCLAYAKHSHSLKSQCHLNICRNTLQPTTSSQ
jgi:hypothetical protein